MVATVVFSAEHNRKAICLLKNGMQNFAFYIVQNAIQNIVRPANQYSSRTNRPMNGFAAWGLPQASRDEMQVTVLTRMALPKKKRQDTSAVATKSSRGRRE